MLSKINRILLYINLFFLQSYLIRFSIGPYPSNLQEVLIGLQMIIFGTIFLKNSVFKVGEKIENFKNIKIPKIRQKLKNIAKYETFLAIVFLTIFSIIIHQFFIPILSQIYLFRHLKFLFFAVTLGFIFLQTNRPHDEKEKALTVATKGAIFFGILSIIYNLAGQNVTHDQRLTGPLDSAVYLAYYFAPFLIFSVIQYLRTRQNSYLAYAIILLTMIFATKSMGAILGTFFVISIFVFKNYYQKIKKSQVLKVSIVSIGILVAVAIFYTKILPTIRTEYSSLDERGEIWLTAGNLLRNPQIFFFGTGPSQFESHYIANVDKILGKPPLDYNVIQPHNIFLLFWFHYGLPGLLFLIFLIYRCIRIIIKKEQKENIFAYIFLYFLVHGLIDTPIYKNDLLFLFLLFAQLTAAIPQRVPLKPHKDLPPA